MEVSQEHAIDLMKKRGYTKTATIGDHSLQFSKDVDEVFINAVVHLQKGLIELQIAGLDRFCHISTGNFDFHHMKFDEFEVTIAAYGAKCMEKDVRSIVQEIQKSGARVFAAEVPATKKTVEDRKKEFGVKVAAVGKPKGLSKETCQKFFSYWTEMNEGGKKMRFEMEKVFDVGRRLDTWAKNDNKFSKAGYISTKAEEQNKQLTAERKVIKTGELF